MKTIAGSLLSHLGGSTITVATLVRVARRDGAVFGFTNHDADIVYGGLRYLCSSAVSASAVSGSDDLRVDNLDLAGALVADEISAADLEAGLWDGAEFVMMEINWAEPTQGAVITKRGELGRVTRTGSTFSAELLGMNNRWHRNIGRVALPSCDAHLGDARCGVNLAGFTHTATLTAVASRSVFTASGLTQDEHYFRGGTVEFTSGVNAGVKLDVAAHAAGGVLTAVIDLPFLPAVGDGITAVRGCNKIGRAGDCLLVFDNLINFRGFEDVPGNEALIGALQ